MTFLARHDALLDHDLPGHPEHAGRARALLDRADELPFLDVLAVDREASDEELRRAHDGSVLNALAAGDASAPVMLDADTYVVPGSVCAARLTARAGILAVRRCLQTGERGFVLCRPPGHHATRATSMGFCLVNNVAIAALDALSTGAARRVLIFDHDVHHGNGTEDVFIDDDRVLFQSFHLAPHYPGTGAAEVTGVGAGAGFTMNAPLSQGMGDAHARAVLLHAFLPAARAFAPDLVLVSAGFDSLVGDPLGGLTLTPAFFGEMIRRCIDVCPKVVCFLEGGYDVLRIPEPFEHELRALDGQDVLVRDDVVDPVSLSVVQRLHGARWGL